MPNRIRSHRHLILLIVLVITMTVQPLTQGMLHRAVLFDLLLTWMLISVVFVIFAAGRTRNFALALVLPAIALRWSTHFLSGDLQMWAVLLHHAAVVAFLGFALVVVLKGIFEEQVVRADHLIGTLCGYVIAGLAWGNLYTVADITMPDSFRIVPQLAQRITDDHYRSFYFNYFSLCTLTGASFGDISPTRSLVATLTWLEAAFGQFYIAVVVAQLVGLRLVQAMDRRRRRSVSSDRG